jgi:hypothetical protein
VIEVAESTVRHYVGRRKQELGVAERETFVPQHALQLETENLRRPLRRRRRLRYVFLCF